MQSFLDTRAAITQLVFTSNPPQHVDLAIVTGCASVTSMDPAVDLYISSLTKVILITGRGPTQRVRPEWERFQEYALDRGIPATALIVEPEARNTRENFLFSEAIIAKQIGWSNISKVAIVAQPVSTRRARMTASNIFPPHVEITMLSPSDETLVQPNSWWKSGFGRQMVLDELRRIGDYGTRGHLGDF